MSSLPIDDIGKHAGQPLAQGFRYDRPDSRLRRDIGLSGAAFLVFNGVVGAGIFALPGVLSDNVGAFSPWMFPLFGLAIMTVVWAYAELAGYFSASGGPVLYTAEAFGPAVSFQVGWLYYLSRLTALAANVNVLMLYAASLWPSIGEGMGRGVVIVAIIAFLTLVNVIGVRRAVEALSGFTLLKALPLLGIVVYGLIVKADHITAPLALPALSAVESTALLVIYAFVGFEQVVVPAGETDDPKRTLPRSLLLTVVAIAALYFVVQLAYEAALGGQAVEDAPLVEFGRTVAGNAGGLILTAVAIFSIGGNMTSSMVSAPRLTFALAREGALPAWFSRVSARYHTPHTSILFLGGLAAILAVTGSFVWLAAVSTLARLLVYLSSIAALPVIRRKAGVVLPRRPVTILLRIVIPAAAFVLCLWLVTQTGADDWTLLIILVGLGTGLYLLTRRLTSRPSVEVPSEQADRSANGGR